MISRLIELPFTPTLSPRQRAALELIALALATPLFLFVVPHNNTVYLGAALLFLGLIIADAKLNQTAFWEPSRPVKERLGRSTTFLGVATALTVMVFFVVGYWRGNTLANPNLLLAVVLYLPWALVQQFIFQHYLHGRLRALLPFAPPLAVATVNGLAYSLVHLPALPVTLATSVAGTMWSYSYQRERCLLSIGVSHAILGTTFYYWVIGCDLVQQTLS